MRIGSLFSGAGGLDMAVEAVFGGEVIWQSEVDKAASTVLAHRFPGVPNLGDITTADFNNVEPVDVICGGFPCQDVSAAGKRAGIKQGTRSGLWSIFADVIDQLRPTWVVIENVRGLLSATAHRNLESDDAVVGDAAGRPILRAAAAVLGNLADLGYDAVWATVAASDVGAPHRRERVFIVATDTTVGGRKTWEPKPEGQRRQSVAGPGGDCSGEVAVLPTPRATDGTDGPVTNCPSVQAICDGSAGRAPRLSEMAAGYLLPTPTAQSARHGADSRFGGGNGDVSNLWQIAHLLPTPVSRDHKGHNQREDDTCLSGALLPTPNASDGDRGPQHPDRRVNAEGLRHARKLPDYALLNAQPERWGKYEPAIRRWEAVVGPAPAPTEPNKNGNPRLSAAFSEWLMGWPDGWVTDPDIGISRNDQLRIIGNGVCPQQATAALTLLLQVAQVAA